MDRPSISIPQLNIHDGRGHGSSSSSSQSSISNGSSSQRLTSNNSNENINVGDYRDRGNHHVLPGSYDAYNGTSSSSSSAVAAGGSGMVPSAPTIASSVISFVERNEDMLITIGKSAFTVVGSLLTTYFAYTRAKMIYSEYQSYLETKKRQEHVRNIKGKLILWFNEINKDDSAFVGGKGANLGELTNAKFPVPPGFCITTSAFSLFINSVVAQNRDKDENNNNNSGSNSTGNNNENFENKVLHGDIPFGVLQEILEAYKKLSVIAHAQPSDLNHGALVAVRSSATSEDSADASFAGQLETFLGVRGERELVKAVHQCWASLYSHRVESYRKSLAGHGADSEDMPSISCSIVVQLMIDADSAGVLFTANPRNQRRDELVITANWGLGESVVGDIAIPDTWIFRRSPGINHFSLLSETIAAKKNMVILSQTALNSSNIEFNADHKAGASIVVSVPEEKQSKACVSREHLQELLKLGEKVQSHYKDVPQDVEWAILKGKIYLLQVRPITTLDLLPPPTMNEFDAPCRVDDWITTCNAAEMFPGAMTPLTMSTFGRMADEGVQRLQMEFGVRSEISKLHPVVGTYYGNLFLNMTNTLSPMCAGLLGGYMAKENGEMSVLGKLNDNESLDHLMECAGGEKFVLSKLFNGMRYVKTMLFAYRRIPTMYRRIEEGEKILKDVMEAPVPYDSSELWLIIDKFMQSFDDQWTDGIITSSTSAAIMLATMKLLAGPGESTWGNKCVGELAVLLGDDTDDGKKAESAEAVEFLDRIKKNMLAYDNIKQIEKFANSMTVAEGVEWLLNDKPISSGEFGVDFRELLRKHGHRCVNEVEMRAKDWEEDPSSLVKLLQTSVKVGLKSRNSNTDVSNNSSENAVKPQVESESSAKQLPKRSEQAQQIIEGKKHLNFVTRPLLRLLVKYTRKGVHLRELGKSLQVKITAIMKRLYRKLASLLVVESILPEEDLTYFLTHKELGVLCMADKKERGKLKVRAIQRRRLLPEQNRLRFPELSQGAPIPLNLNTDDESSNSNGATITQAGVEIVGTPVSSGIITGHVRVINHVSEADELKEGEILVCPQTDVAWSPYFSIAGALITEIGGLLSHGAVVAREYGLPCVVGVSNACTKLRTGQFVKVNADSGTITILS